MSEIIFKKNYKVSLLRLIKENLLTFEIKKLNKRKFTKEVPHNFVSFQNDQMTYSLTYLGGYEFYELDVFFSFIKKHKLVNFKSNALDIGAFIGTHSIFFSKFFKKVYSFEPNSTSYEILKFNTKKIKNIKIFNFGLFNKSKKLNYKNTNFNRAGGSLIWDRYNHKNFEKVKLKKLDNLHLGNLGLIKIDVEGSEKYILEGALNTIKKQKPIIIFEQQIQEFDGNSTPSIKILKKLNYNFFYFKNKKKNLFLRNIYKIKDLIFGRSIEIIRKDNVPKDNYNLLIAIHNENKF